MSTTYEIRPCLGTDEGEVYQCPEWEVPDYWTVYRRGEDGLGLAVCDFLLEEDAQLFVSLVELAEKVNRVDFKYAANRISTKYEAIRILETIKERLDP